MGIGMALLYLNLIAAISDRVPSCFWVDRVARPCGAAGDLDHHGTSTTTR